MTLVTIDEFFKDLMGQFIFTKLYEYYQSKQWDSLWLTDLSKSRLDEDYYFKNCERYVAPSVIRLYENFKEHGISVDIQAKQQTLFHIAWTLATKYHDKWERLFKLLEQEHNGLNNIDITEIETPDEKTSVNTDMTSSTESGQKGKIYGFNSSTAVPSGDVDNESETTTTGDYTKNYRTRTGTITKTQSGRNKDVQELIKSELELLQLHDFYDIIYNDISFDLALGIY